MDEEREGGGRLHSCPDGSRDSRANRPKRRSYREGDGRVVDGCGRITAGSRRSWSRPLLPLVTCSQGRVQARRLCDAPPGLPSHVPLSHVTSGHVASSARPAEVAEVAL